MKEEENLMDISNKNSVLVEFVNEENNIQTGLSTWLTNNLTNQEFEVMIKEKIITHIYWPDCDIMSAKFLKKILKKASFVLCSVRIIAHGGK